MAPRPYRSKAMNESGPARASAPDAPSTPTTVGQQLEWATRVLETVGVADPTREAASLLASAIGWPSDASPNAAAPLAASEVDRFLAAIARRSRHETEGS